jgi:ankyrin repeat protein
MVQQGCSLNVVDDRGDTPLIKAVAGGDYFISKSLIDAGAMTMIKNAMGYTALHVACSRNFTQIALMLIPVSKLNAVSTHGMTPLLYACRNGNLKIITEFLAHKAHRHIVNSDGEGCLILTVISNQLNAISYLLDNSFDVNIPTTSGLTPLMRAITVGSIDAVKVLLESPDIKIGAVDFLGKSALDYAVSSRDGSIIPLIRSAVAHERRRSELRS